MRYTPDEIAYLKDHQAPVLEAMVQPESAFYWTAYHHLRGSGFDGMGRKPIPFSEISAYATDAGIADKMKRARLVKMVVMMDNTERAFWAKKASK